MQGSGPRGVEATLGPLFELKSEKREAGGAITRGSAGGFAMVAVRTKVIELSWIGHHYSLAAFFCKRTMQQKLSAPVTVPFFLEMRSNRSPPSCRLRGASRREPQRQSCA